MRNDNAILIFLAAVSLAGIVAVGAYRIGVSVGHDSVTCPGPAVQVVEVPADPPECPTCPPPVVCQAGGGEPPRCIAAAEAERQGFEEGYGRGRDDWRCTNLWKVPDSCRETANRGLFRCREEQP